MMSVSFKKELKQHVLAAVTAFSAVAAMAFDTRLSSDDEKVEIKSFSSVICSAEAVPNAFCLDNKN